MKLKRSIVLLICASFILSILSGCALPRRKDLKIDQIENTGVSYPHTVTLLFSEVVSGKPLNETVWDNVEGPFWDQKESQQIGFTQNYKAQFFAIPPAMLPLAAQSGAKIIDTQIVIPFGNIFSTVLESGVQKAFKDYSTCFSENCASLAETESVLKISVEQFFVWERPLNHLNFYVKGTSEFTKNNIKVKSYNFEKEFTQKKLGGVLSTHSSFIKEMNRLANIYAKELSSEILQNGIN